MQSRAQLLHDPERERSFSIVDPRPVEAAVLDSTADTMMDMLKRQIRGVREELQAEREPDDPFLDDDELEQGEGIISPYELADVETSFVEDLPSSSSDASDDSAGGRLATKPAGRTAQESSSIPSSASPPGGVAPPPSEAADSTGLISTVTTDTKE